MVIVGEHEFDDPVSIVFLRTPSDQ
jgi:hypothetical protein